MGELIEPPGWKRPENYPEAREDKAADLQATQPLPDDDAGEEIDPLKDREPLDEG